MPRFEFVESNTLNTPKGRRNMILQARERRYHQSKESILISPKSPSNTSSCNSTTPTPRAGQSKELRHQHLLVPSIDKTGVIEDCAKMKDELEDQNLCVSSEGSQSSYDTESYASSILETDDEKTTTMDLVTTIAYHPRGGKPISSVTTVVQKSATGKFHVRETVKLEPAHHKMGTKEEPLAETDGMAVEVTAAHNHYDAIINRMIPECLELNRDNTLVNDAEGPFVDSVMKNVANAFWYCSVSENNDPEGTRVTENKDDALANLSSKNEEDASDDDDTEEYQKPTDLILDGIDTFASTEENDSYTSYVSTTTFGTEDFDDETRTYDDETTLTYGRRGPFYDMSTTEDDEDETITTYNDVAGVTSLEEDATTFSYNDDTDYDRRDDADDYDEADETGVSNEDSSYGSQSFRSPLSDSYERSNSHHNMKSLPRLETRSISIRSPRHAEDKPKVEESYQSAEGVLDAPLDSMSYTKSRNSNRTGHALINSFITMKSEHSNSTSSKTNTPRAGAEKNRDGFHFRVESENAPNAPTPKASNGNNKTSQTEDTSSKTVKITITKTTKTASDKDPEFIHHRLRRISAFRKAVYSDINGRKDANTKLEGKDSDNEVREGPPTVTTTSRGMHLSPKQSQSEARHGSPWKFTPSSPTSPTRHTKSPIYRTAGPLLIVDPATMPSSPKSIDSKGRSLEERSENLSPNSRLRNQDSYDVLSCD